MDDQLRAADTLEERFGVDMKLISVGVPESLALMHRDNPTPYDVINSGVDRLIHARVSGGFEGWIAQLEAENPDVILLGPIEGKHIPKLMKWLQTKFRYEQIGTWDAYIRK